MSYLGNCDFTIEWKLGNPSARATIKKHFFACNEEMFAFLETHGIKLGEESLSYYRQFLDPREQGMPDFDQEDSPTGFFLSRYDEQTGLDGRSYISAALSVFVPYCYYLAKEYDPDGSFSISGYAEDEMDSDVLPLHPVKGDEELNAAGPHLRVNVRKPSGQNRLYASEVDLGSREEELCCQNTLSPEIQALIVMKK